MAQNQYIPQNFKDFPKQNLEFFSRANKIPTYEKIISAMGKIENHYLYEIVTEDIILKATNGWEDTEVAYLKLLFSMQSNAKISSFNATLIEIESMYYSFESGFKFTIPSQTNLCQNEPNQ